MADHVCPVWAGYFLSNPLRKLTDNPVKRLSPYVKPGMTVMDVGCAMGFFSLPMAKMVGPGGKVFCIDLQEKMIHKLYKRAKKKNLQKQIEARVCRKDSLNVRDINNSVDFILASAVVHEVPDSVSFFTELYRITAEDGRLLVIEPGNRVSLQDFRTTVETAVKSGFYLLDKSGTRNKHTALFGKTPH